MSRAFQNKWRQNGCCRLYLQSVTPCKDTGLVPDFQHFNELQPLCFCMYNHVWIMPVNCVGTSHCGSLCSRSLCFHIWLELWSGRCVIYMTHTHNHRVGKGKRDIALCWQEQRAHTLSFWCSGIVFWYPIIRFTYLRLLRLLWKSENRLIADIVVRHKSSGKTVDMTRFTLLMCEKSWSNTIPPPSGTAELYFISKDFDVKREDLHTCTHTHTHTHTHMQRCIMICRWAKFAVESKNYRKVKVSCHYFSCHYFTHHYSRLVLEVSLSQTLWPNN